MEYKNILLEMPAGTVAMSHSVCMDVIRGESSTQNMDWTDYLLDLPWSKIRGQFPDSFEQASLIASLLHMDYQVCNGGIGQYFCNGYHEAFSYKDPDSAENVALEDQKEAFLDLVTFAKTIFPDRTADNEKIQAAAAAFNNLEFEENATLFETVYCEEDKEIYDEELEEWVENPDYFEPYDEEYQEDVIHGDDGFDNVFYDSNEYLELLVELRAQYECKDLAVKAKDCPEVYRILREQLPASAFCQAAGQQTFASRLEGAVTRSGSQETVAGHQDQTKESVR